tara:strand:+ start:7268 stop:8122 length:855 start_codon:yes stop_codon:yes gene_type:complete
MASENKDNDQDKRDNKFGVNKRQVSTVSPPTGGGDPESRKGAIPDVATGGGKVSAAVSAGGFKDVNVSGGKVISAAEVPEDEAEALADALADRFASGYGQIPAIDLPVVGPVQTPIGGVLNLAAEVNNKNLQNQLKAGGVPVYGSGDKITVGYNPNADIKDLKGVVGKGLFGGTAYSGAPMFNPNMFDEKGNRVPVKDDDGPNDNQSALGGAVQAKPIIKKEKEFAKAVNENPQGQKIKVKKPKAAGDGEGIDGALVRRTKTLQSNRRGILGRPDSKKKTLLGA